MKERLQVSNAVLCFICIIKRHRDVKDGTVAHSCTANPREVEVGVQDHLQLHKEFKADETEMKQQ